MYHYKSVAKNCMKETEMWPFKIKSCKRLIIAEVNGKMLVRVKLHYELDAIAVVGSTLLKKSKNIENVVIPTVNLSNTLSAEKRKDVSNFLVKYFGDDWKKECFEQRNPRISWTNTTVNTTRSL